MTSTLVQPVTVHRTKPVGVPIQKSPAKPPFDPPVLPDDDDDDDDEPERFFYGPKVLVIIVILISVLFLAIRRRLIKDDLWVEKVDNSAVILIQAR